MTHRVTVSRNSEADFTSIQAAVDSVQEKTTGPVEIFITAGIYREKVFITRDGMTLRGESPLSTIISFDDYALKEFPDGRKYGTFNSYTLFAGGNDFTAENLSIENTAGPGDRVGQAIALYSDGDRHAFRNCRFTGSQDTVFVGPLPPASIIPGGFSGPREHAERKNGRRLFDKCFISGDIDFIFGSGTAVFTDCEIHSLNRNKPVNGYITAASTPAGQEHGFIFLGCRLSGDAGPESVYLGRPWREHAKTVFISCEMGNHIARAGWDDWNKEAAHTSTFFAEYASSGPGAHRGLRAFWCKNLSSEEAADLTASSILSKPDGWNPFSIG